MTSLFAAVFVASLLGSTHCAGMCGAFLAFAVSPGPAGTAARSAPRWQRLAAYNLGRLTTYVLLGVLAGLLGAAVNLGGAAVGLQRTAAALAGAIMVGFGVVAVLRLRGVRVPRLPLPPGLRSVVEAGHRAAAALPPTSRALSIGLLTTLLPCGWLYAFAVTAAGTADAVLGGLTMAAFWAGTLPVMVSLGAGLQRLTGPLQARVPLITSLALVAVGLATVFGRVSLPAAAITMQAASSTGVPSPHDPLPCCHP